MTPSLSDNFSSAVLPKPNDWKDHIFISGTCCLLIGAYLANSRTFSLAGYWFLDDPPNKVWDPPAGLLEFIQKARNDGKAVVYVGFGSIVVRRSEEHTSELQSQ